MTTQMDTTLVDGESQGGNESAVHNKITQLKKIKVVLAGSAVVHAVGHTVRLKSRFERNSADNESEQSSDNDNEEDCLIEDDLEYLRSLDPKEWKDQDHYAVLGLKKLRYKASDDLIKRAYKQKILKHHPDKREATGAEIRPDDDYFTCITKAWETLGNPAKRISYDSVDPFFSDDLPDEKEAKSNFYSSMGKAFEENARWSVKQPVPKLGDDNTSMDAVEHFYTFWYAFDSWREYSYLDEEDKDSAQDRDMRKWIEKKNRNARAKRKKEELQRIRLLVDTAYRLDPRIKKFRQEEKDKKTAAKRAKQEAARARQLEEERVAREAAEKEREERLKREAEEKAKQNARKQEREIQKKALRKERKALRDLCKSQNYFTDNPTESIRHMEFVEKMCELFKCNELESATKQLRADGRDAFINLIDETEARISVERQETGSTNNSDMNNKNNSNDKSQSDKPINLDWSENDIQLLIKAVNLFPAGTSQRWEVVANFINQHANNGVNRNPKEVLAKAKDLQSTDFSKSALKEQANKNAFDNFIAEKKAKDAIDERMPAVTERVDPPSDPTPEPQTKPAEPSPWTPSEQQLLEQALKTYSNVSGPEKWDLIATCIPNRTKKECMRRYKELVELIKAKKAAQVIKQ